MLRPRSATNNPVLMNALALCVVVLAGGLTLAWPFWGDQALFTLYSREMTQGAVLYRDVFDVKQPGIFLFYAAGGLLFGFTEIGMHVFELVYWLTFSVCALVILRPYFATRWAPPLVPVFTVGAYYFGAGLLDIGQVEILVAFPILLAWWLIDRADPTTTRGVRRYVAAGLAAAVVVMLKHLYLLIVIAFLAYAALRSRRGGTSTRDLGRALTAFVISLAAPLILVLLYFAYHGQLGRIWWAYFEMAPAAQLLTPRRFDYLKLGMRRFLIAYAPLTILAVLGSIYVVRHRSGPQRDLAVGMLLWGVVGAFAFIGLQGWPEYKWALFTVPLGTLGVLGVDSLVALSGQCRWTVRPVGLAVGAALGIASFAAGADAQEIQTRLLLSIVIGGCTAIAVERLLGRPVACRRALHVLVATLAVSVGLAAIPPGEKLRLLSDHDFALTADSRTRLQHTVNPSYKAVDRDLAVLQRGVVLPGPFYVFGDPILLFRANREQAVPILGWGPEFLDDRAWRQLDSDLRATVPPYIVVDGYMESYIRKRCPALIEFIESRYEIAFTGDNGRWYVVRESGSSGRGRTTGIPRTQPGQLSGSEDLFGF
jgi:hypothetical protein